MTGAQIAAQQTDDILADEVLAAHFTLVEQPGAIEPIALDGAEGWTSPNPHPALSLMRWTTTDPQTAGTALDTVLERFRDDGRGFDWMTGPRCAAAGLPALLETRGFVPPPLRIAAMVKRLGPDDLSVDGALAGFRISKVPDKDDARIWHVMAQGFDVSDDVGAVFHHAYLTPSPKQSSEVFAVTPEGSEDPVSVGYLSYTGGGSDALMRVSSTAEDYRGQGLYRALVLRRLAEAARRGCQRAMVHAYSEHSQIALSSLGFDEVGELQLHRWRP